MSDIESDKRIAAAVARGMAPELAKYVAAEIFKAVMPLQCRLDHLTREIALLKMQERGRSLCEQTAEHEADDYE